MSLFAETVAPTAAPMLGVLIFMLGGLAGAIFYLPFKRVKAWAWESYWLVYAVFGLVIVPWALALTMSPNVFSVLKAAPPRELGFCFLCGMMWGVGGLTWGLMIRYLGVGLGLAIGCGLCSAAGTLIPPVIKGQFMQLVYNNAGEYNAAGLVSLAGVAVSLVGIIFVGGAGMSKEKELPEEEKKKAVAEYNFKLGLLVAIFSGLMSAGMSFGLQGGATVEALACPQFTSSQFDELKLPEFASYLRKGKPDSVPGFVYAELDAKTKDLLSKGGSKKGDSAKTLDLLTAELNRIAQAADLYRVERFVDVGLSDAEKKVALAKHDGNATARLNRLLLEKAFPQFIKVKSPQLAVLDEQITSLTWRGMSVLVVVLLGGFVVNGTWCLFLNVKNRTTGDYVKSATPVAANIIFAGLAGAIWCSQFICFKTGEPAMGKLDYIGWSVLMASSILFSTMLGIFLGEWRNTSGRTRLLLTLGLLFLVASAAISAYSGYLK